MALLWPQLCVLPLLSAIRASTAAGADQTTLVFQHYQDPCLTIDCVRFYAELPSYRLVREHSPARSNQSNAPLYASIFRTSSLAALLIQVDILNVAHSFR